MTRLRDLVACVAAVRGVVVVDNFGLNGCGHSVRTDRWISKTKKIIQQILDFKAIESDESTEYFPQY